MAPVTRGIQAVLFDVDDTLVDTRAAFRSALVTALEPWLPGIGAHADAVLRRWRGDPHGLYQRYTRGECGYHTQRRARVDDLLAQYDAAPLDAAGYEAWSNAFDQAFAAAWAAWPDTDVLAELARAGLRLGAISNAPCDMQRSKLAAVGLDRFAPLLVGIDTLGVGKPEPEVFLEGCRRLGSDPEATAYVGDEYAIDAVAASATGLFGIWVRRPGREEINPAVMGGPGSQPGPDVTPDGGTGGATDGAAGIIVGGGSGIAPDRAAGNMSDGVTGVVSAGGAGDRSDSQSGAAFEGGPSGARPATQAPLGGDIAVIDSLRQLPATLFPQRRQPSMDFRLAGEIG